MSKPGYFLSHIDEAPIWCVENRYLLTGYRNGCHSFDKTLKTLFRKHNETMNIWTHLIGMIFFISLCFILPTIVEQLNPRPKLRTEVPQDSADLDNFEIYRRHIIGVTLQANNSLTKSDILHRTDQMRIDLISYFKNVAPFFEDQTLLLNENFKVNSGYFLNEFSRFVNIITGLRFDTSSSLLIVREFLSSCLIEFKASHILHFIWNDLEYFPILVFLFGAILCFTFSTLFHWFCVVHPTLCHVLHKLDYAGISFLNFGSSFAIFYYYFYCRPFAFWIFTTCIFLACFSVFCASMSEWIDDPVHHRFKGFMYGFLGISNLIPFFYILYLVNNASPENDDLPYGKEVIGVFALGAIYLTGLAFYITKFPERKFPYKFDFWLHSHAIWHCFVFGAALTTFYSIIWLYQNRLDHKCIKCVI